MIFVADNFHARPYGFTTNQISHATLIGFLFIVYGSCIAWFYIAGEFPHKEWIAIGGAVGYAAFELLVQGWRRWDTVEDWWFVVVYGVFMPLLAFDEMVVGEPKAVVDLTRALPLILVFFTHLGLGALYRWLQQQGVIK